MVAHSHHTAWVNNPTMTEPTCDVCESPIPADSGRVLCHQCRREGQALAPPEGYHVYIDSSAGAEFVRRQPDTIEKSRRGAGSNGIDVRPWTDETIVALHEENEDSDTPCPNRTIGTT